EQRDIGPHLAPREVTVDDTQGERDVRLALVGLRRELLLHSGGDLDVVPPGRKEVERRTLTRLELLLGNRNLDRHLLLLLSLADLIEDVGHSSIHHLLRQLEPVLRPVLRVRGDLGRRLLPAQRLVLLPRDPAYRIRDPRHALRRRPGQGDRATENGTPVCAV